MSDACNFDVRDSGKVRRRVESSKEGGEEEASCRHGIQIQGRRRKRDKDINKSRFAVPTKTLTTTMSLQAPPQWPKEVSLYYEPVRILGKGGFGSVILGRRKPDAPVDDDNSKADREVAIKVVGSKQVTDEDLGYAHREMDILTELSHPHIMKLIRHWEPAPEEHLCAAVMVLSYAPGPTLYDLIRKGGALGFVFGRVVAAQIVDAVAYLHSRAVVHRDIKADNMVITGATMEQDEIWNDNSLGDRDWAALCQKWHVTVVDFGFARALTSDDMKKKPPKGDPRDYVSMDGSSKFLRRSRHGSIGHSNSSSRSLKRSTSRLFNRQMSALGNRDYAAPEITKKIEQHEPSIKDGKDIFHTISKNVSYYGLQVDAYSLGVLLRYALSGVPPHENIQEFLALQNNPFVLLAKLLCCSKPKEGEREPQYRSLDKIPAEVFRMIKGLLNYDPQQRTTIRTARLYPYIDDVLDGDGPGTKEVHYLDLIKSMPKKDDESAMVASEHEA